MLNKTDGINVDLNTALDFCSLPILFLDTERHIKYINFAGLNFFYNNEPVIKKIDPDFSTLT